MTPKRLALLILALGLLGGMSACAQRTALPAAEPTPPAEQPNPILIEYDTPSPLPQMTPTPTPTPEPTGRALRAWELQKSERKYFEEHPPANGDIEKTLASLSIDPDKKLVALTFDDGPSNMNTNRILDVLEKYNARATFFIIGKRIENHTDVIARAISLNCEIGNHTWAHSDFTKYSKSVLIESLTKVDDLVQANFGYKMRLFRPPYAAIDDNVEAASAAMGYTMVVWSGSSHDWSVLDADKAYANCFNCAADGAIILFHDIYPSTAEAIERIVPDLIKQGYQLVTVSELIAMDETPIKPDTRYGGWAEPVSVKY